MKIINIKNKNLLASDAILANSIFKRVKGLLGRKDLPQGSAMILKPCNSIHTFFMQFPIDVVFVSRDNRVVKLINSFLPNRMTPIYWDAYCAIEFPAGTLSKTFTTTSDFLEITP